jgi:hypothetical protein
MKTAIILSFICFLIAGTFIHCEKDPPFIPPCIQQKIDSIKVSPNRSPPAEVHLWNFEGRKVYLFNAPCCGEYVKVMDENCEYVCSPSGGPLQYGDSLCTNFYQDAKYVGLIFRDDR